MPDAAPDVLAAIVGAAERCVDTRRAAVPESELEKAIVPRERGRFAAALRAGGGTRIIAECKRRSPSRGVLRRDYDPVALARSYQAAGAAAISVLTEPAFFDGAPAHLQGVRRAVALPILRKDFIVDRYQLLEACAWGADAVLLIVAALSGATLTRLMRAAHALELAALVEVHDRTELQRALDAGAEIVGVNNRNLRTLDVATATARELIESIPDETIAVAESGLTSREDVERLSREGYDAFLVGERLVTSADPAATLARLLGRSAA
jgi:indole-3-glycerol phosphate synthase